MKTVIKFFGLGALAIALSCGIADVNAMYGKMRGGMSYTAAQTGDAAAQQKVAEAQALAIKINTLKPRALNNLPSGMTPDEFIYELLNWPDNVVDASHNAKIANDLRLAILAIDNLNNQPKRLTFRKLTEKLSLGYDLLSEAKVSDQKITKETVTEVLREFVDIDTLAATLLDNLNHEIVAVETIDRDPIEKFRRKIGIIEGYINQFTGLNARAQAINLPAIVGAKRAAVHQAALQHYHTHGKGRADPLDVRLTEPTNRTMAVTADSIGAKRLMTAAIVAHVTSLAQQLQLLQDFNQLNDDAFVEVWTHLAEVALSVAAFTKNAETPYETFLATGLLKLGARRDITIQDRLFNALPANAKRPTGAPGVTDPALDAEYLIPNPRNVDWSVDR
ncbi:MAG: hypothetical protein LBU02_01260 [Rickettsiales bacterium]|nr:hypothetical protein [Rickettsiales bacterium]